MILRVAQFASRFASSCIAKSWPEALKEGLPLSTPVYLGASCETLGPLARNRSALHTVDTVATHEHFDNASHEGMALSAACASAPGLADPRLLSAYHSVAGRDRRLLSGTGKPPLRLQQVPMPRRCPALTGCWLWGTVSPSGRALLPVGTGTPEAVAYIQVAVGLHKKLESCPKESPKWHHGLHNVDRTQDHSTR